MLRLFHPLAGLVMAGAGLIVMGTGALASSSGQLQIGPQSMEGALHVRPGDPLDGGFDFTIPGGHPAETVSVSGATVAFLVQCPDGSTPAPIVIHLPDYTVTVPAGDSNWFPSGDQAAAATQQGRLSAPDRCSGQTMNDSRGAQFNATFSSTSTTDDLHVRFHYADPVGPSSWSATLAVQPAPSGNQPATCAAGQTMVNGTCTTTPPSPTCSAGQTMVNGTCTTPPPSPTCSAGQTMTNGGCTTPSTSCPAGQVMVNGVCTIPPATCAAGQIMVNGVCTTSTATPPPAGAVQGITATSSGTAPGSGVAGVSATTPTTGVPGLVIGILLVLGGAGSFLGAELWRLESRRRALRARS